MERSLCLRHRTLTSSSNAIATLTNTGNAPLTVTGYTSTNAVDYSAADGSTGGCEAGSPVAAGASCSVNVTFAPGAGEQGTLTSQIGITSTAVNAPIAINATGTGLPLATSATKVNAGAKAAQVINTPLSIAVAPNERHRRRTHWVSHGELHHLDSSHSQHRNQRGHSHHYATNRPRPRQTWPVAPPASLCRRYWPERRP